MASFYPVKKEGPSDVTRVAASLRAGAAKQENVLKKQAATTPGQQLHRSLIAKENSAEDVLRIAHKALAELDANNSATAIHKAAQCCRRGGRETANLRRDTRLLEVLRVAHPNCGAWTSRQLCHVAWSLAVLSMNGGHTAQLLADVCDAFGRRVATEGVPQDMSTFVWSLATLLAVDHSPAFDITMRASMEKLSEFGVQDLAISAWALAKLLFAERRPFLAAFASESTRKLQEFGGRNLSSISWAYAAAQHRDLPLFAALVEQCSARVTELGAQELPITLWALAVSGYPADAVFRAAASQAQRSFSGMDVSHICNIAWAYARAGPREEELFEALGHAAAARVRELEPLHLANLCWSFANVSRADELNELRQPGQRHPALFAALTASCSRLAGELVAQHHSSILWAFGVCQVRGIGKVIDALLPGMRRVSYDGRQVAGMLWTMAVLSEHHRDCIELLLRAVAEEGVVGLVKDGPAHLASIVWATARLPPSRNGFVEKALAHPSAPKRLASELLGSAAELSEGRRQNIAAVVRSMYDMGLSTAASALLDECEVLGNICVGTEAWAAWLCGAAGAGDAELEVKAWAGLADNCDGVPRSTVALNAAAARGLSLPRPDLSRWALNLLVEEAECDSVTNFLRSRVGLPAEPESRDWSRGECGFELSLVRRLWAQSQFSAPQLLRLAEAEAVQSPEAAEALGFAVGMRGAIIDAALRLLPDGPQVVLELGCGVSCATLRAACQLPAGSVIGCDLHPVRAAAAICLAQADLGVERNVAVDIRVGQGEQLLPRLREELGPRSVNMVVLGSTQGTEYQEELARLVGLDLLAEGAVLVADRLLEPMAPEFLWLLLSGGLFEETVVVATEDGNWTLVASHYRGVAETQRFAAERSRWTGVSYPWPSRPPEAVSQLRHSADEARRRTVAWRFRNRLVAGPTLASNEDLEAARRAYEAVGLRPAQRFATRRPSGWEIDFASNGLRAT